MRFSLLAFALPALLATSCAPQQTPAEEEPASSKIRVIFDTDANNELDDQHALAYLLFNSEVFEVEGVTVNATLSGGNIDQHYAEADRIIRLCGLGGEVPLLKGADKGFSEIRTQLGAETFDGAAAVDFIIQQANAPGNPLVLLAVGKLTNVALALEKDPSLAEKMKVVWLGSNYPEPGEYNQDNDTAAMNYVLNTLVPFEMVTVRYGKSTGTDAVKVTQELVKEKMPGLGPKVAEAVEGRHGQLFNTFGDYAVNLFENIEYHGDPPSRALFDMAAVAIVKNPGWANKMEIAAPILVNNQWQERPENTRKIALWQNFNRKAILNDFFQTLEQAGAVAETN